MGRQASEPFCPFFFIETYQHIFFKNQNGTLDKHSVFELFCMYRIWDNR